MRVDVADVIDRTATATRIVDHRHLELAESAAERDVLVLANLLLVKYQHRMLVEGRLDAAKVVIANVSELNTVHLGGEVRANRANIHFLALL